MWDVVCLAALEAMERGRWCLRVATPAALPPGWPAGRVVEASVRARASFWGALADFAALGLAPRNWAHV